MTDKEIILYILDWLRCSHEKVFAAILDEIPDASIILAGRGEAHKKLRELLELEGTED